MNKESLEKMNRMRLLGMHLAFKTCIDANQTEAFTNDELVHHLVQSEWDDRQHNLSIFYESKECRNLMLIN